MIAAPIALLLVTAAAALPPTVGERVDYAQLIIRERVVVRVPATRTPPRLKWREKKAPRCMSAEGLAGAALMENDTIDLIARGGKRFRVQLTSACPGIDFYGGFYLVPSTDQKICAGRDAIHARSGGKCQIKRFRTLVADD